ncbi:DUF423 domain-containing protein [Alteromonas aestuariivivens]|uniref:DUF423 domain-containing protein n=1 Tax=Alteromonas aestuariivivens TaxID=1938339 RepID=A0A3D8MBF9_9ALTE|nr:DUF423 domain-containing protein [Alteromonas aestuariivivens]RDV27567.1 DUF423 domain-containing protein [Alteromonas aestuariivivens]
MKGFILFGVISALLAVILGAFGAHGLKAWLEPAALQTFEIGVRYQMYHALAILLLPTLGRMLHLPFAELAGWLFVAGTVLFSGSLYLLATLDVWVFGPVTPLGGLCFIGGWLMFLFAALKGPAYE